MAPGQFVCTSCTAVPGCCISGELSIPDDRRSVELHESLRGQHVLSRKVPWDCRKHTSPCSRDPHLKESNEPPRLNYFLKLNCLHSQLAVLEKSTEGPAHRTSNALLFQNAGASTVQERKQYGEAQAVMDLCEVGQLSRAIDVLIFMGERQSRVSTSLLYRAIRRCGAEKHFALGKRLDDLIVKLGYGSNAFLGNHLLRMYASQGRLTEAMIVFTRVPYPDAFMWSSMISAQSKHGKPTEAILLYREMRNSGLKPDAHVFVAALHACARAGDVESGRKVHVDAMESGMGNDSFVCSCLVDMYAKCRELEDARRVFDNMGRRNAVTWNTMINGYAEHGLGLEALRLYETMEQEGLIVADGFTYACLLKACASSGALEQGKQLHLQIVERGLLQSDIVVGNCLVDMYAKCGKLEDARMVFDSLHSKNAVTWTAIINGYAEHGLGEQALDLYARMEEDGLILADSITYGCLLKACASAGALHQGRQLHTEIVRNGLLQADTAVGTCLVNMYVKCGELDEARIVFHSLGTRDAVAWNTMLSGYVDSGFGQEALTLYERMEQECLILADGVTFACLLRACASTGALQQGRQLHSRIVERGLLQVDVIVGTCLVDMYASCGKLEDARMVFDSLAIKNEVTWTAMINGYVEQELGQEALNLYSKMETDGQTVADSFTFACLLKACASAGAVQQGKQLHQQIAERGLLESDAVVGTCLVNMYAKCGKLNEARVVFDSLATRNTVTWNAMISGYGKNNEGQKAVACFEEMMLTGTRPDHTTYTCILVACSHEGLVSKGRQYFDAMVQQHGLHPTTEHYNCMVDLLGRAGHLEEAEKMLLSVGCKKDAVGLMSLLNACKSHGDIERGTRCFQSLLELDSRNASAYVLMANMFAEARRWADVDRIERLRKLAGATKKPAVAFIEVNNRVHTFVVGDERDDISYKVRCTNARLKEEGNHVPHITVVLKPLSEKDKEDELCGHAEKLALAYGLLNTPDGTPMLVTKNLRMCRDCHSSTEIMSRVENRDIVVRDAYRVHRFGAGSCSCNGRH